MVIVGRIAQQPEEYISWAVFAALLISGLTTVLQAVRFGRLGSGYVLMMGTSGTFIAVCVGALVQGGPETMATLIVVSALFQFLLAARLSWLRRIFTPVVSGTVIMLIAATVMPLTFASLTDIPEGTSTTGALWAAAVTLLVVVLLILPRTSPVAPMGSIIAIVAGTAVSVPFGLYETGNVVSDPLIGLPKGSWPGLNFNVDARFWALLPAFVVATIVGAIETIGDGVAIQSLSRRKAQGHRLPGRARRPQRGRSGQPSFRPGRHPAQHDLFLQHFAGRGHGRSGAPGWALSSASQLPQWRSSPRWQPS